MIPAQKSASSIRKAAIPARIQKAGFAPKFHVCVINPKKITPSTINVVDARKSSRILVPNWHRLM